MVENIEIRTYSKDNSKKYKIKRQYYLTSYESALQFIKTLSSDTIKISQIDFK